MVTPELLERLRAAYREWHDTRGRSIDTWMALMADEVEIKSAAEGAPGMEFSAPRKGKNTLSGYFAELAADWEMIHYTPEEFLADGDRVAVFSRCAFRNRKTGKTAEGAVVNLWHFRDGRAVRYFEK